MRLRAPHDVKSSSAGQDGLSVLFSQMLNSPQQSKNNIIQDLANTGTVQGVMHPFPTTFKVAHLKSHYRQQTNYLRIFPNVFTQLSLKTPFVATWRAKLMLKCTNLPFSIDVDNHLQLKTLTFTKISLLLQMLIYLSENQSHEASHLIHATQSSTATYINQHLGATYSQGQFIDFVDRLYDQYKHTKLSPYAFRHLFRCFGCHTPTIGNAAFDHYIQLRNTEDAWQVAVVNHLQSQLSLPKLVAQSVAKLLINTFSLPSQ